MFHRPARVKNVVQREHRGREFPWLDGYRYAQLSQVHVLQVPLGLEVEQFEATKAAGFLEENPLAKIVVLLDTPSTVEGGFVTGFQVGAPPTSSSSLSEVRLGTSDYSFIDKTGKVIQSFIPKEVAKILASPCEVDHSHRVFILNGTCGEPVLRDEARLRLLAG